MVGGESSSFSLVMIKTAAAFAAAASGSDHLQRNRKPIPQQPHSRLATETSPRPQAGLDHAIRGGTYGHRHTCQAQARLAPSCGIIISIGFTGFSKAQLWPHQYRNPPPQLINPPGTVSQTNMMLFYHKPEHLHPFGSAPLRARPRPAKNGVYTLKFDFVIKVT